MKKKITTTELASFIAQREGTSKSSAEAFVRKFFEVIERGLLEDKYVKIKGLGTFKLVVVGERESVNVQTGERFQISGHTKVSFTPDNSLKELVNRPFAHFMAVDLNDDTETEELEAIDQRMAEEYHTSDLAKEDEASDEEEEDETDLDEEVEETALPMEETPAEDSPSEAINNGKEQDTEPAPSTDTGARTEAQASAPVPADDTDTEDKDGPEIHTDSPIISISTGDANPSATASASSAKSAEAKSATIAPQTGTPIHEQTAEESLPTSGEQEEERDSLHPDTDDICVSDPHPINHHTEHSTTQIPPTTNSMGYSYSEVPSPKKHNWWKTATITICALLLMACCYYAGYFRLLCPTCEFSPLLDSWSQEAQPSKQKVQTDAAHQPAHTDQQKDTTNVRDTQQAAASQNAGNGTTQTTDAAHQGQSAPSTSATNTGAEPKEPVQPQSPPLQSQAKASSAASSASQAPAKPQSTFHKVKAGENLTRIVRRHYGSEAYVNMVIKHNHLKNADNVTVGMVLELPPKPQASK